MKKSEAMDLYEGLNGISPKMIEEAGNYKKTASVDIRYKKSNNVKKIIAAGLWQRRLLLLHWESED